MKLSFQRAAYVLLLLPLSSFSQQIYIGQNASEVNRMITAEYLSNQNARGYNQVTMQYQPLYNNGKLSEILLCKQNVPMIDLHRTADFCTHYVISNAKLSYILIEYSNVSIQELEGVMDQSMRKIGDYYFGNSNQYVYFKLMKTGEVDKVYRDISKNPPPANILKQLVVKGYKNEVSDQLNLVINKSLPLSKFLSTKSLAVDGDDLNIYNALQASHPIKINFSDPKGVLSKNNKVDTTLNNGELIIQNNSTGEIYKKLYVQYIKKESNKALVTYWYKIINVSYNEQNILEVSKWSTPLEFEGKSYFYSFKICKLLTNNSTESDTILLCNKVN